MRIFACTICIAGAIVLAPVSHAQSMPGDGDPMGGGGHMGGGMGRHRDRSGDSSQGGERREPRATKPISREHFNKLVSAMFAEADTRHEGLVTLDELNAYFQTRRDAVVRERFKQIDTDGNGVISLTEFTAWQSAMGSAALNDSTAAGDRGEMVAEEIGPQLKDDDMALRGVIEPLSATLIAKANTNYDAGLSLQELLAYEDQRFDTLDTNHDGYLAMDELRANRPGAHERQGQMDRRPPPPAPSSGDDE